MSDQRPSADAKRDLSLEIAHILFIDTVDYSKLSIPEQRGAQELLNRIVRDTGCFRLAEAEGKLIRLPTGDGMALVFKDDVESPLKCALEISERLRAHPKLRVRMGIHSGPVSRLLDVNDRANIAGAGVNIAQRVMSCGDAGHILLSKRVADDLTFYSTWQPHLHDLGEYEFKHGTKINMVNFYTDDIGNPRPPVHFTQLKTRRAVVAKRRRRTKIAAGIGTGLLIAIVVLGFFRANHSTAIQRPSVAVLPFRDFSPATSQEYFTDGIVEQITTSLTQVEGLLVVARTSSFAFKGKDEDIRLIGQKLGVRYLIEGSVSRIAGRTRVTAQLIDVSNGYHFFSKNYDSTDVDLLSLQTNVAEKIADALQAELHLPIAQRVAKPLTANPEASDLYLRGRYLLNKRSAESIQKARDLFEQAVAKDANFALGHAGIADSYILLGEYGELSVTEAAKRAWPEVTQALRLDDQLAEAYFSRAILLADFEWRWDAAERDYRKAIQINPNNSTAHHWLALFLAQLGRIQEGLDEITIAESQDPLAPIISAARARILLNGHRFDEAATQCRKALELEPNFAPAYSVLAQALAFQHQYDEAIAAAKRYVELAGGGDQELLELAYAEAVAGKKAEAQQAVAGVQGRGDNFSPYDMAAICVALSDKKGAIDWLSRAIDRHSIDVVWIRVDPRLDNMRNDPDFQALLGRVFQDRPVVGR